MIGGLKNCVNYLTSYSNQKVSKEIKFFWIKKNEKDIIEDPEMIFGKKEMEIFQNEVGGK